MHSDDLIEFLDLEGHQLARRAMGASAAQLARLCSASHCATKGSRTIRADRTRSAGWIGHGAAVVVVSPAEQWGWLRSFSDETIVRPAVGRSCTFQCGGVCRSESGRFDDRETLDS